MKALCWRGKHDVAVERVPDPRVLNPRDAIIKVTSTAICGSDLHLYDGYIPTMMPGDILCHEFIGEVVFITGGSRGLGFLIARQFARAGCDCDLRPRRERVGTGTPGFRGAGYLCLHHVRRNRSAGRKCHYGSDGPFWANRHP